MRINIISDIAGSQRGISFLGRPIASPSDGDDLGNAIGLNHRYVQEEVPGQYRGQ